MASVDLHNNIDERVALNIQTITTNVDGEIIDTAGYESIEFLVSTGTWTAGTITPKLQDGDDSGLSDAADVASDFVVGSYVALGAANGVTRVGYVGKKRYVRLSAVSASANLQGGAIAVLGSPHSAPVAQ